MRTRPFALLSALAGLTLFLLLALAPGAGARATGISDAAEALKQGPVYVDPGARSQLSEADQKALAQKIENADKPVFIAVLPEGSQFPADSVLRDLRTATGITGLYGIRLGDGFDAGADRSVMPANAVQNIVSGVKAPGVDAATQLDNFVDQALPTVRGTAPSSWSSGSEGGGASTGSLIAIGTVLVAGGAGAYALVRRGRRRKAEEERDALEKLRVVVDEDITAYGEELDRLDFHPSERGADDAMRADYERALDSYEDAKSAMASAEHPHDVRGVTEALEEGRYSLAVLSARREGAPLPERRAPCFFDPRHGPSTTDMTWTPSGGSPREVPVCAADAVRLRDGEDPLGRTVETESGRRPYWEAGPAYGPWAGGYYGGGLLPGLLAGTLLGSALSTPAYAAEYGGGDFGGGDVSGGDFSSSDFGGGGFGGDWGGGGGFDGGGGF
ncbi:hypothetical protein OHA27_24805 [Streptomyces sp. NBC_01619]|uniref:hypothetical protein n=1 Tax=unclassified Streptomyces TaxID=2593676 RepID=UPI00225168F5|nr:MULTISPECIES: hypothetical protein [unclassified Streptomyces]MCX4513485.1 hypothetical protein [Streptomyces sp. NBC_01619]